MIRSEWKSFLGRWIVFILFFIPVVYLGIIAAVTLHEVVGHGAAACLLGGTFSGFGILIDGMGWARVDICGLSAFNQAIVLAGGTLVTNLFSIVFLVLGIKIRKYPLLSIACLTLAFALLCDGLPYFFWDALYQGGIGDASGILGLYPYVWLRILILVLTGSACAATVLFLNHLLLGRVYDLLGTMGKAYYCEFIIVAITLLGIQTAAWFSFDWTHLIPVPETGLWPPVIPVVMTAIYLGVRVATYKKQLPARADHPVRFKVPVLLAWGLCAVTIAGILLFLQHGVAW